MWRGRAVAGSIWYAGIQGGVQVAWHRESIRLVDEVLEGTWCGVSCERLSSLMLTVCRCLASSYLVKPLRDRPGLSFQLSQFEARRSCAGRSSLLQLLLPSSPWSLWLGASVAPTQTLKARPKTPKRSSSLKTRKLLTGELDSCLGGDEACAFASPCTNMPKVRC